MRRLKLFVAASLDGYIAGPGGDTSWLFRDGDYGYAAFFAGIDTELLGRRPYEESLAFDEWPYPERQVVVFTRGGDLRIASPNTAATARAPADVVAQRRAPSGTDLSLARGVTITPA